MMSLREIQNILFAPEVSPDDLIRCALGIKTPEIHAYCILTRSGPISIQTASEYMNKSRSTAQRLLQNLVEKGLATREEQLIGLGGYKYVYKAVSSQRLKEVVANTLEKWYSRMLSELEDLPEKIDELGCTLLMDQVT